jgi:hypothetical protein
MAYWNFAEALRRILLASTGGILNGSVSNSAAIPAGVPHSLQQVIAGNHWNAVNLGLHRRLPSAQLCKQQ